ncbi:MAG: cation-transporting P-type ATPase, partial [Clostridiales bacterium]|nr:cation-transporting P-type ATPase [Clostridiales bacterium]
MIRIKNKATEQNRKREETTHRDKVRERILFAAAADTNELFGKLGTREEGLSETLVEALRDKYGENQVTRGEKASLPQRVAGAFLNPFTVILILLAIVSAFTDI